MAKPVKKSKRPQKGTRFTKELLIGIPLLSLLCLFVANSPLDLIVLSCADIPDTSSQRPHEQLREEVRACRRIQSEICSYPADGAESHLSGERFPRRARTGKRRSDRQ